MHTLQPTLLLLLSRCITAMLLSYPTAQPNTPIPLLPTTQPQATAQIPTPIPILDLRSYGGGNCQGCDNGNNYGGGGWTATAAPAPWKPTAVTVVETVCDECHHSSVWAPAPTTDYETTTYCPPTTTQWHSSYVPVVYTTVAPQVYTTTSPVPVYAGYCSTLYAKGPGLPTTRQGSCGTILVVNGGGRERGKWLWGLTGVWVMVLGRVFLA